MPTLFIGWPGSSTRGRGPRSTRAKLWRNTQAKLWRNARCASTEEIRGNQSRERRRGEELLENREHPAPRRRERGEAGRCLSSGRREDRRTATFRAGVCSSWAQTNVAMDNVVLNIYDLLPDPSGAGAGSQQDATTTATPQGLSSFLSGLLAPLGFGAYHTSLDVRGFRYQFGAGNGITRSSSPHGGGETAESRRGMPANVAFRESIIVGQTWFEQKEINQMISRMREGKWKGENYHLANRNCNHFR